jgi:hypothetical protein
MYPAPAGRGRRRQVQDKSNEQTKEFARLEIKKQKGDEK